MSSRAERVILLCLLTAAVAVLGGCGETRDVIDSQPPEAAGDGEPAPVTPVPAPIVLPPVPTRIVADPEPPAENNVFTTREGFPEYRIGPRDVLELTIYRSRSAEPERSRIEVPADGRIMLPALTGVRVHAAGRSVTQLRVAVEEKLSDVFKGPLADVVVLEYNARKATLVGEVQVRMSDDTGPGVYALTGMIRVLEFLHAHGGPTRDADLSRVGVLHRDGSRQEIDLEAALAGGWLRANVIIDDGDIIFVPRAAVAGAPEETIITPPVTPDSGTDTGGQ